MTQRLDKALVDAGLASTRSQALQLIKEGVVFSNGKQMTKASTKVSEEGLEVRKDVIYVGRGAHKIEGALKEYGISVEGKIVADVGASTGGFTDYVLKNGATKVYAIDVGHDQLAQSLVEDERVINLEGTNIRHELELSELCDLAVVDLSFISLKLTLPSIMKLVHNQGEVMALVKPQFEIGKEKLGKNGIVKSQEDREFVLSDLYKFCEEHEFFIKGAMRSPITGTTGNVEYFFYFDKNLESHGIDESDLTGL